MQPVARRFRRPRIALLALAALTVTGCASSPEPEAAAPPPDTTPAATTPRPAHRMTARDLRFVDNPDQLGALRADAGAADPAPEPLLTTDDLPANDAWGILLETFTGADHALVAADRLNHLASALGRQDLRLIRRAQGSAIVLGDYTALDDGEATRDLAWVHALRSEAGPMYPTAHMIPPDAQQIDDGSDRNLAMAKRTHGAAVKFTLEIGIFDSPDEAERREYAERAVGVLRDQGESAFYYHGSRFSSVTIGAFTDLDYDPVTGYRSAAVRDLMGRHPNHLYNGAGKKVGGVLLPSRLVQIPDPPA